jgi:hypothetical protein
MRSKLPKIALALGLTLAAAHASAALVNWTDWTRVSSSGASGTLAGTAVTVTGTTNGVSQAACGGGAINYWTQPNASSPAYTGGTVSNAPTACEQVGLNTATSITITFSSAIDTLYMALVSVGQPTVAVTYDFDRSFAIDSQGVGYWSFANGGLPGSAVTGPGDTLTMREFHGMLRFGGGITSLTFTTNPSENWHAFTLGTLAVSAPGTLALGGLGLMALGLAARRRAAR